ncbi:MAG: response regulator transcription factor [Chloroflexaceae bacterium]|nr:response regulator transcription factor [Chloroflexaceae bacterium]
MYATLRGLAVTESNQAPVRILLADDHRIFRQGLRELIERKTPFVIVGEAATGREVLHLVATLQPDIVLLDIQLPELDGVAVARQLAGQHPAVRVVMLTMYREDQHLFEAIKAGARAYLLKDVDADELVEVLGRVQRGEAAIDPVLTAQMFAEFRRMGNDGSELDALTERERDILQLLAAGYDNRTIAARLHIAEKTVGNRLSEIFQKLGVTNRTQAALVAVQRGLISAAPELPKS